MESPLVKVERGKLEPKIISLYKEIFTENIVEKKSAGFWTEFFLLPCSKDALGNDLAELTSDQLLANKEIIHDFFKQAIKQLSTSTSTDQSKNILETLNIFLDKVFSKKYQNFSSDIILLLTGLEDADSIFYDFITLLDTLIRSGTSEEVRIYGLHCALITAIGSFRTSVSAYFLHRNLFGSIMKFIDEIKNHILEAFLLLGILSNISKFDSPNPYKMHFADYVNAKTMDGVVKAIIPVFADDVKGYNILDQNATTYGFKGILSILGLSNFHLSKYFTNSNVPYDNQITFPAPSSSILLSIYEFSHANSIFSRRIIKSPLFPHFISFVSYIIQYQHFSLRSAAYARYALLIFRIWIEDTTIAKELCTTIKEFNLCSHKVSTFVKNLSPRPAMEAILDCLISAIDHNKKKLLDVHYYDLLLLLIQEIIYYVRTNQIRLEYHWTELWRSLFQLIRFLANNHTELKKASLSHQLAERTVTLLMISINYGDSFLSDTQSYDDLFYKLLSSKDAIFALQADYNISSPAMSAIIDVINHFEEIITKSSGGKRTLSQIQVSQIIRQGSENLSISSINYTDNIKKYQEKDERIFLKKAFLLILDDIKFISELQL